MPAVPVPAGDAAAATTPAAILAATVGELETLSRFDRAGAAQSAEQAIAAARELGLTEFELRARLVQADLLRRRGNVAEAGRIAQDVHRWATANGSRHLLARSHFVLTAVFQELGDVSMALEHAVRAVDLLGDTAPAALHIDHLVRLADCLSLNRDDAAPERYSHVLRLAEELGDVDRQLQILNNRAYCETLAARFDAALDFSTQLQTLAAEHGVPLDVGRLDTIARALIGLDRLEDAEAALLPGLTPEALQASLDGDAGADFLLTLAEVQRRRGRIAQAQESLDECVRRCDQHGLTSIRVRARGEQAELHAAGGRFRTAFEEHKRYCQELMKLQSAERDARARALQAMYETTEARRQSRRYRELSLRDPLTGLYNRRYVDEQLPRLLGRGSGPAEVVSVALLDLDFFKRVNDTYSHEVGDQVLRAVAELLEGAAAAASRGSGAGSFAARMGGEEFLLVLVGGSVATAARRLEDVRRTVSAHPWGELTGTLPITVSIGAASTAGLAGPTPADLLSRADAHLYQAKRQGRDQVVSDAAQPHVRLRDTGSGDVSER
jgi:diguanylate cyclase (GGDEF)-like protein